DLAAHLVLPRGEAVAPGGHAEAPPPAAVDLERAGVAVVPHRQHRRLAPAAARRPVADRDAEHLVAVAKDVGPHVHAVARRTLHREASAVELGPHVLDLNPGRRLAGFECGHRVGGFDGEGVLNETAAISGNPAASDLPPARET